MLISQEQCVPDGKQMLMSTLTCGILLQRTVQAQSLGCWWPRM